MVSKLVSTLTPGALENDLRTILSSGCQALFRSYRLELKPAPKESLQRPLISEVQFSGGLSGRLTLALDRQPVLVTLPIRNGTERDLEDWSRELVNQLMGLVKNELLVLGYAVRVSLPSSVPSLPARGHQLDGSPLRYQVRQEFETGVAELETVVAGADSQAEGRAVESGTRRRD